MLLDIACSGKSEVAIPGVGCNPKQGLARGQHSGSIAIQTQWCRSASIFTLADHLISLPSPPFFPLHIPTRQPSLARIVTTTSAITNCNPQLQPPTSNVNIYQSSSPSSLQFPRCQSWTPPEARGESCDSIGSPTPTPSPPSRIRTRAPSSFNRSSLSQPTLLRPEMVLRHLPRPPSLRRWFPRLLLSLPRFRVWFR
jgi:hypothetical protein